jgi:hypothetical protein
MLYFHTVFAVWQATLIAPCMLPAGIRFSKALNSSPNWGTRRRHFGNLSLEQQLERRPDLPAFAQLKRKGLQCSFVIRHERTGRSDDGVQNKNRPRLAHETTLA